MTNVKTTIETITPEVAAKMLEKNAKNRSLRPRRVAGIARDIAADNWQFNGDSIKIDADGWLLDGQHRLHGCIKSGIPIRTVVVRGLPSQVRRTIDSGAKRTIGDRFQMGDVQNANATAAALSIMFQISNRLDHGTMTSSEADTALGKHPSLAHSIATCRGAFQSLNSRLAAIHYIGRYIGQPERADDFINVWRTGIPCYPGDAAHVARERILQSRGTARALQPTIMARLVLHSFNLFLTRRSVKGIKLPDYFLIRGWDTEAMFNPTAATISELAGEDAQSERAAG